MTFTFPVDRAVSVDVLGAQPGIDPETGGDAIAIALSPEGSRPQIFTLSVGDAHHLREVLADALRPSSNWLDDDDVAFLHASVRWDEPWVSE